MINLMDRPLSESPIYHEIVKPAGIAHSKVISTGLPLGETYLGIAHSRPETDPFGEAAGLQLLRMLLPAFKAGVDTLVRLCGTRTALEQIVDLNEQALLIYDIAGRELHRSERLSELLADEPERQRVLRSMTLLARSLCGLRPSPSGVVPSPDGEGERGIRTRMARYRARGSYIGRGVLAITDAVLVSLERLTPTLPSARELIDQYGLTQREAEVATLLAAGRSNGEISDRLTISPHTVRHHAEAIFAKLGIHSRKALALRLLEKSLLH